jgi:hypothetical protein
MNGLAIGKGTFAGIGIAKRPAKTVFTTVSLGILGAAKTKKNMVKRESPGGTFPKSRKDSKQ